MKNSENNLLVVTDIVDVVSCTWLHLYVIRDDEGSAANKADRI